MFFIIEPLERGFFVVCEGASRGEGSDFLLLSRKGSVNFVLSDAFEYFVTGAKRFASEKASVCRERRRMRGLDDKVFVSIDQGFFLLSKGSSQDENEAGLLVGKFFYHLVGKVMSSDVFVRIRGVFADRQSCV